MRRAPCPARRSTGRVGTGPRRSRAPRPPRAAGTRWRRARGPPARPGRRIGGTANLISNYIAISSGDVDEYAIQGNVAVKDVPARCFTSTIDLQQVKLRFT